MTGHEIEQLRDMKTIERLQQAGPDGNRRLEIPVDKVEH
jgi:hypothetical protein